MLFFQQNNACHLLLPVACCMLMVQLSGQQKGQHGMFKKQITRPITDATPRRDYRGQSQAQLRLDGKLYCSQGLRPRTDGRELLAAVFAD